MTDATDHALEQAERIVQYAKYSDRFMVVEGDSAAERRAFVKLIGQKLPRQVRPVLLRADAGNGANALIEQLSTLLQLSAGIETIEQLISAATAALDGQERLLVVVENADHWLASEGANALFELITQSHDLARERLLFLLVGATGLCEQAETAQPLAGLVADLHCAHLLGTTTQHSEAPTAAGAAAGAAEAPAAAPSDSSPASTPAQPGQRSAWASPTLLIAGVVSIAVVSVGLFALLGRSEAPTSQSTETAIEPSQKDTAAKETTAPTDGQTSQPNQDEAPIETAMVESTPENTPPSTTTGGMPDLSKIDHGRPPHVPFPPAEPAPASSATSAETEPAGSMADRPTEAAEPAATPVSQEARGVAVATPPAEVDNDWYREQPRARAAIQMAAFGKLDDANKMIERFAGEGQPRDEWRIYTQRIDGKILYTVTLGNYPSAERARHAIDELPSDLTNLKPYPRSVGAIQDRLADASP